MRGTPERQMLMLSSLSTGDLIPADHPIRRIRVVVDEVLAGMDGEFDTMYAISPWVQVVQVRLSTDGTYLAADGIFGPRTEAAVVAAQRAAGLEPTGVVDAGTWSLFGEPLQVLADPILVDANGEFRSLDLFPADTNRLFPWHLPGPIITLWSGSLPASAPPAADAQPPVEPAPVNPPQTRFVLREDGFADTGFGEPAETLLSQLETEFGSPSREVSESADPGPFGHLPWGYWAAYEFRFVEWDEPGLSLVLADEADSPRVLRLVSWHTTSGDLRMVDGFGIGSTLTELHAKYPELVVGVEVACDGDYRPTEFLAARTTEGLGDPHGLRGSLDWDWVADLQRALNAHGAHLEVDGIYGPATEAAVTAFLAEHGLEEVGLDGMGSIGPVGLEALGVRAVADSRVVALTTGEASSC